MQVELDSDANHRALRRCHGCGAYARPAEQVDGMPRCERCTEKARLEKARDRPETDPTKVDFLV
jgi:hypothetical protein